MSTNESTALIAAALRDSGWCHLPSLIAEDTVAALRADLLGKHSSLRPAAVGRAAQRQQMPQQRSDSTLWLDGVSPVQRGFLDMLDTLRQALNRQLFLGLTDCEAHYAHYAPGQFYRRHVDTFQTKDRSAPAENEATQQRVVSAVFYLNDNWNEADGGELLLVDADAEQEIARLAPVGGSAVFFLSAEFPHEVLAAKADRYSIAAWFRNRGA
ncbi:MAG: hypothetical protein JWM78_2791 [Verrucomicrobiaceae bacterium]|nr:hypothetical protein [Verrucomicrobiaceae bacterium]